MLASKTGWPNLNVVIFHLCYASYWTTQNSDHPGDYWSNSRANSWATGTLTWAGWINHSWRFGLAEALREVGPRNAWMRIKNVNGARRLSNFWNFFGTIQTISCRARLVTMDETWLYHYDPETKQKSMEWRHSGSPRPAPKIPNATIHWKSSRIDFLGSRRHLPHWLSSKGPNYQRGVLLISAGAFEGHFKEKRLVKVTKGALFLDNNASAHRALATEKKLAYLGFQCLYHPPYSPDLAPSDYHLFPGMKKQLKGGHFSSKTEVIAAAETWLNGQISEFFWVACKS